MRLSRSLCVSLSALLVAAVAGCAVQNAAAEERDHRTIRRVPLISVDGMHAVDFSNCAHGISTANNGEPYCPAMAALSNTGINYVAANTSNPRTLSPA